MRAMDFTVAAGAISGRLKSQAAVRDAFAHLDRVATDAERSGVPGLQQMRA